MLRCPLYRLETDFAFDCDCSLLRLSVRQRLAIIDRVIVVLKCSAVARICWNSMTSIGSVAGNSEGR